MHCHSKNCHTSQVIDEIDVYIRKFQQQWRNNPNMQKYNYKIMVSNKYTGNISSDRGERYSRICNLRDTNTQHLPSEIWSFRSMAILITLVKSSSKWIKYIGFVRLICGPSDRYTELTEQKSAQQIWHKNSFRFVEHGNIYFSHCETFCSSIISRTEWSKAFIKNLVRRLFVLLWTV